MDDESKSRHDYSMPEIQGLVNTDTIGSTLLASLIWGAIGSGFAIYGWKQQKAVALAGGVALVAVSYVVTDALWMSVTSVAIIAATIYLRRMGE